MTLTYYPPPSSGGGGGGAVDSVNGQTGVVLLGATDVGAQPVDSDLTAIAALTTTAFGRGLLALADAAAGRTAFGLGTAATHAHTDYDLAGAAAAAQSASQPLDSDLTAIAALTTTAFGRGLLALADAAAARSALGLGTAATTAATDYQPIDSDLTAIAGISPSNDDLIQRKAGAWINRTMAQIKTDLALAKGDVGLGNVDNLQQQPIDSDLTTIAGLTATTDNFMQAKSSAWASRTPAQVKTDLAINNVDNTSDANKPVSTAQAAADATLTVTSQSSSYTLVLADAGKIVEFTGGSLQTVTVPTNSVAYPTNTVIGLLRYGAGAVTVVGDSGVTVRSRNGLLSIDGQYAGATLWKRSTTEWVLTGALTT
jgi:hypothetical protein